MKKLQWLSVLFAAVSIVTTAACSGGGGSATPPSTPTLSSIVVTPANLSMRFGSTQQLTATGNYSDGSTQDLTSSATWTASAASVTVDGSGLAAAAAIGSATVTAAFGLIAGSATLTVIGSVSLPKTGQTLCYDSLGNAIACAGTGQDGEAQKGVMPSGARFTVDATGDCVADNLTGLMWVSAPSSTVATWANALASANDLTLCGYSDWRLPNRKELRSLADFSQVGSAAWLNTQGFTNVQADYYWSSTSYAGSPAFVWAVGMGNGYVAVPDKASLYYVWPVRAGQ